jgi:hypothetical protein
MLSAFARAAAILRYYDLMDNARTYPLRHAVLRPSRCLWLGCAIALAAATCSDQISNPLKQAARVDYVSGGSQSGLVGTPLEDKLQVRVVNVRGQPVANVQVAWSVMSGGGSITPSRSASDNDGYAAASWTLGTSVGEQMATAAVPGLQTALFISNATIVGHTCDGSPLDLPLGASITLVGAAATDICVTGSTFFTNDYLVVAFNSSRNTQSDVGATLITSNTIDAAGPPLPDPAPGLAVMVDALQKPAANSGALRRDHDFDARVRAVERSELPRLLSGSASNHVVEVHAAAYSLANPAIGELLSVNANALNSCSSPINRTGRVVAISQRAIIVEDTGNPAGGFSGVEYLDIARTFDTLVYPVHVEHFGEPSDIDGNGKIFLFHTIEVNRLTAPGAPSGTVSGFFFARDLFPKNGTARLGACAGSNQGEFVYLMAADPQGTVNGNQRDKEFVAQLSIGTLAHEFEHLINASRRLHVNPGTAYPEVVWLDEGLAHSAEELVFHRASTLGVGQNILAHMISGSPAVQAAYVRFQSENVERLRRFLVDPNSDWAFRAGAPDLAARGAVTWFLRYSIDRLGGDQPSAWRSLVAGPETGMVNLERVLQADPVQWMRDWTVALYADDVVHYTSPRHQVTSWSLRSMITNVEPASTWPLIPFSLPSTGKSVSLLAGGAAYFRFGVAPSGVGRLQVVPTGADAEALSLVLLRTR